MTGKSDHNFGSPRTMWLDTVKRAQDHVTLHGLVIVSCCLHCSPSIVGCEAHHPLYTTTGVATQSLKWAHFTDLCVPNGPGPILEKHIFDPLVTHFWFQNGPFSRHFGVFGGPQQATTGSQAHGGMAGCPTQGLRFTTAYLRALLNPPPATHIYSKTTKTGEGTFTLKPK